ncbi:MAG TPA: histidine phosphatase family protein [Salinimicrobium sp.]|nr:histidine phosphatase family protein [Salinimicrobium sp.]
MKTLILVRHGKSSWKDDVPDRERTLKKRAFKDASLVAGRFKNNFELPQKIWTSNAVRARETAKLFKEELGVGDNDFLVKPELYIFDAQALDQVISQCSSQTDRLMVFGHNFAITELANSYGDYSFDKVPTTGLVAISFNTDSWKNLKDGRVLIHLFPKALR